MGLPTLVRICSENVGERTFSSAIRCSAPSLQREGTSVAQNSSVDGMSAVRRSFEKKGISDEVTEILLASWKDSTKSKYNSYIKRWYSLCSERNINSYCPDDTDVLNFLADMHGSNLGLLGYSSINAARSALSTFVLSRYDNCPIGNSALVKRFMRGIFVLDPPRPRYTRIWDV